MATKKKLNGDVTRTARAGAYLERLDAAKGKRVVIDLDAGAREALEGLLATGYADTQSGVIRRAILAATKQNRQST